MAIAVRQITRMVSQAYCIWFRDCGNCYGFSVTCPTTGYISTTTCYSGCQSCYGGYCCPTTGYGSGWGGGWGGGWGSGNPWSDSCKANVLSKASQSRTCHKFCSYLPFWNTIKYSMFQQLLSSSWSDLRQRILLSFVSWWWYGREQ